jgi:outer membrane immunogenic protein
MVRKSITALLAVSALAAPAFAADEYHWTGFHVGLNLGYSDARFGVPFTGSLTTPGNTYSASGKVTLDKSGFVGGGQFGYDYLFANGWLVGFETDAQATTADATVRVVGPMNATATYDLTVQGNLAFLNTARARVGYVLPCNLLVYGTGGLAYGGVGTTFDLRAHSGSDDIQTYLDKFTVKVGWTLGAGVEYPLSDRISLRGEYLYADLGANTLYAGAFSVPSPAVSGTGSFEQKTETHLIRIAINYAL